MTDLDTLLRALRFQGGACAALGSTFSAALLESAAADIAGGGPTRSLFAPWSGADTRTLITEAVSLRLLGALHDLALAGDASDLAAAYPAADRPGDATAAWAAGLEAINDEPSRFTAFMAHEPQTNEVRRSACLLGGFLAIAEATGLPLRLFEVGASAGLNQLWDRFRYDLAGAGTWGDPAASVLIDAEWRGPPPALDAPARVVSRAACDRKPVDLADPVARRRLRAYVWPDQLDRMARLDAAVETALAAGVRVEAEDAVAWTASRAAPADGAVTVLFHSVFWQYLPAASQAALAATIESLGAAASAISPFAWLRMEPGRDDMATMEVRLTLWPDGQTRRLAHVHPHGAWVEWSGGAET